LGGNAPQEYGYCHNAFDYQVILLVMLPVELLPFLF